MKKKLLPILISITLIILIIVIIYFIHVFNYKKQIDEDNKLKSLSNLLIETKVSDVIIKHGEELKINVDNEIVEIQEKDDSIVIKDRGERCTDIEIIIPDNFKFNQLFIEDEKGDIDIDNIETDYFDITSSSGTINLNKITVNNKTELVAEDNKVNIFNAKLHNIDFQIDNGIILYEGILYGQSEINSINGIINLHLQDDINNYKLFFHNKKTKVEVNNKIISSKKSYGHGTKNIVINGEGSINIKTEGEKDEKANKE